QSKLEEVWSSSVRAQVQQTFTATGKAFAAGAFDNVATSLDRYGAKWVDMHTDACRATSVRKEQSEQVLDLRMTCLEQRRSELRTLLELLSHADASVVAHASDLSARLGDVARCADLETLRAPMSLPTSPEVRAQVDDLRRELARGLMLSDAGKDRE